jgi:hypothetical protein
VASLFMRVAILGVVLATLAGCSTDIDPVAASRAGVGQESRPARPVAVPQAALQRQPDGAAALPDRGDLLAYQRDRTPRRAGPYTLHPVGLSEAHALRAVVEGSMVVTAPNGQPIRLEYARHVEHPDGNWTWIGRVPGASPGQEAILTFGDKAVFGTIPYGDELPLRLTMAAGRAWLVETDRAAVDSTAAAPRTPDFLLPPAAMTAARAGPATASASAPATASASATAATTIDLVLGYTNGFAARLGGASQAVTRLTHITEVANQAYANSQVAPRLRLVRTVQVNYPDNTENQSALYALSGVSCIDKPNGSLDCSSVPVPAALQPLVNARNQYGADMMSLVRKFTNPENDSCGIAWLLGGGLTPITAGDADAAISVVSDSSGNQFPDDGFVCSDETLAHELGHNMGSAHDRDTADGDDNVLQTNEYGRYEYSFGHITGPSTGNFYTVMSYGNAGQNRYRVFSNPAITYCGGRACGVANQADNARSLRQTMPVVAAFRAAVVEAPASRILLRELDVNGNGKSDLMFFNHPLDRLSFWRMNGATRESYFITGLSGAYRLVDAGDFDRNGRDDLLFTNDARQLLLAVASGSGYTLRGVPYAYAAGTEPIAVADRSGDGRADILLRRTDTGVVTTWVMSGTTRTAYSSMAVNPAFTFVGRGDLNANGRSDLLWEDGQRRIHVTIDGVTSSTGLTHSIDYQLAGMRDVNGDRRADLLLHDSQANRLVVWFMNGKTRTAYSAHATPAGHRLVATGDFDGNDRGDLVLEDPANSRIKLMVRAGQGFATQSVAVVPQAGFQLMDVE